MNFLWKRQYVDPCRLIILVSDLEDFRRDLKVAPTDCNDDIQFYSSFFFTQFMVGGAEGLASFGDGITQFRYQQVG